MPDEYDPLLSTDLAAHLRHRAGRDLVEEWEMTERETEQGRLRRRLLSQIWEQAMHRGDRVQVQTRFGQVTGSVDYVGTDYAAVRSAGTAWDLRLERCVMTAVRSRTGGHSITGGSRTFRARLAEYEATREEVTLLVPSLHRQLRGRLSVVAKDHSLLVGDGEFTVPNALIDGAQRWI